MVRFKLPLFYNLILICYCVNMMDLATGYWISSRYHITFYIMFQYYEYHNSYAHNVGLFKIVISG